ncbi:metallophosphoesterase family protein [Methylococcus sp. EFPC2]|nr:metallophosphoesterase family protein [Methylococcus sp. EFPC2]
MLRVGLISDTHGLLRPEALAFLRGCEHIIHAGDIGHVGILEELRTLAPLAPVRGNNDRGDWAQGLPETEFLEIGGVYVYVIHDLRELDIDPGSAGVSVVVSGHSHVPRIAEKNGVLYVNPGSSGPRRFKLPVAVGELILAGGSVSARIVELDLGK